jgi:CheY-like chemotaxis protein
MQLLYGGATDCFNCALSLLNDHLHRYNPKHMAHKDPLATSGLPALNEVKPRREGQAKEPKILILVVDDSADNVAVISLDLQQQGYRVVTASNGEDAVAVATQMMPNLILMDINLPTLDGLGATRRIRENDSLRDVPIVAITAFGTEGFQRAAYDAGLSGYLTKPIDFDRMHLLIARLLSPTVSGNLTGGVNS